MSSTSFDALLNFDQEIIRNVVHKTLPEPRVTRLGVATSSTSFDALLNFDKGMWHKTLLRLADVVPPLIAEVFATR